MWSTPSTPAQEAYFSKHAPKRRIYGLIQALLQVLHAFLAFAAWYGIFAWAFEKFPVLLPAAPWLAATLLLAFHLLFRVTWSTFWYDKLDGLKETDSSPFIPLLIIAVLLLTEVQGARIFLQGQVNPPEINDARSAYNYLKSQSSEIDKKFRTTISDIESIYKAKINAVSLPYTTRIAALKRRKIDDAAERRSIYNQITALEQERSNKIAPIESQRADALQKAQEANAKRIDQVTEQASAETTRIMNKNASERMRYDSDMANAGSVSWAISAVLLALIMALGYAIVRINVKSGILPLRNFTILDAHGSMIERLWTALSDAFNRRSLQLAVSIHRGLSPSEALRTFDGRVVAMPGTYNSPEGMFNEKNTPAPPSESDQLGEAWAKVFFKLERLRGIHPGYTPGKTVLNNEMNKALTMNGSYAGADWDDPDLGKP